MKCCKCRFLGGLAVALVACLLCVNRAEATSITVYENDFEVDAVGWTMDWRTFGPNFSAFLGNFGGSANQITAISIALAQNPSNLRLEFDFYALDSWENEFFRVYINDVPVVNDAYHYASIANHAKVTHVAGDGSTNMGYGSAPDHIYHYSIELFDYTQDRIELGFGASLNESSSNESFGVDNLAVVVHAPTPAAFSAGLVLLTGLMFTKRRRAHKRLEA
jgi:hypothetical protein